MNVLQLFIFVFASYKSEKLIWISLDGFYEGYLSEDLSPTLFGLAKKGFHSLKHKPSFVSKTFPNHLTSVTGLDIQTHEIVDNYMFTKKLGSFFMNNTDPKWWDPKGTTLPVWTLNNYINTGSAVIFWPGSNVKFGKNWRMPRFYFKEYDPACNYTCRFDKAVELMKSSKYNLIMIYIADIDMMGHRHGPFSAQTNSTIKQVDKALNSFLTKLKVMKAYDNTNFMITSDHGMAYVMSNQTLVLQNVLPKELNYTTMISGPVGQLDVDDMQTGSKIINLLKNQTGVKLVTFKKDLPTIFKYSNSSRIPDIIIIMEENWSVFDSEEDVKSANKSLKGDHGYPVDWSKLMTALFIGFGPRFRMPYTLNTTHMKDLYSVACDILEIKRQCANYKTGASRMLFPVKPRLDYWILGLTIGFILVAIITFLFRRMRTKKTKEYQII